VRVPDDTGPPWVDWKLAHLGERAALAAIAAHAAGGTLAAWREALKDQP
jgi:hypothetical protein